jgi:CO/xanthine dehydrogenase Mo-binding subunit
LDAAFAQADRIIRQRYEVQRLAPGPLETRGLVAHYQPREDLLGYTINPLLVRGQVHGGIVQGIGQALWEGMVYSPDGQPLTGSLLDYALPAAAELPEMIAATIETPSPMTPLGIKDVGELPTVAAPAAVANAVLDALSGFGVRHIDTPLTAEKSGVPCMPPTSTNERSICEL